MEITTLLGVIVGLISVIGAMIFKGISFTVFLNPAAFFVIIVGTIATILNSYPGKNLKCLGTLFKILFTKQKRMSEAELIKMMVGLSSTARREGLLALEGQLDTIEDPFIKKGLRMVIDGMNDELIEDILGAEISAMEERHEVNASIFSSAGMYAPTLGVLGAVFGLIAAMSHINDVEMMSEAISAAFIATILGIFTGYVLWNPFAKKLKVKSKEEAALKQLAAEGILSIQSGDSPAILQEKLLAALSQSEQDRILKELNQG
ncbi:flagellar motor stator protein MotA [Anaeromicropila herbilytica]|uniref:Flagellar motor protein MotA n=1 Tax=Anaeromicropila herbilytica TaxID=2785025 RepID=A0A7R7IB82_9FIRM|nr:flagellar motor stator protein MotA [Anaeromicropila herbilytica]BCN29298.1 flagellar motor protein MotA [Anaeromicropila herbilytica]